MSMVTFVLQWAMLDTPQKIFEHVLAMRDLSDPVEFLTALYFAEGYPAPPPLNVERFEYDRMIVERYHAEIFNRSGRASTAHATRLFLKSLAPSFRNVGGQMLPCMPRAWIAVFRLALAQGLINRIAFGAAVSTLFINGRGSSTPALPAGSPDAIQAMLEDMRRASPMGLMSWGERQDRNELPQVVTVYRGGSIIGNSVAETEARMQASQAGLFWTPSEHYAREYLGRRKRAQTGSAALGSIPALRAAFSGIGVAGHRVSQKVVTPYIVRAEVPRDLILAYWHVEHIAGTAKSPEVELVIDFERLTPDMIVDVTGEHDLPGLGAWAA